MGKPSTITTSKASCPLLFEFLIKKGKKLVNKKPRMGTHPSKYKAKENTSQHNLKKNRSPTQR
jgi:hypothetical protein